MSRIIAGGFACGGGSGAAPNLCVKSRFRGTVRCVTVPPESVEAGWVLTEAMSHGAPGVNQIGHEGALGTELRLFVRHLHPAHIRLVSLRREQIRLRKVIVRHVYLAIDRVHRPG